MQSTCSAILWLHGCQNWLSNPSLSMWCPHAGYCSGSDASMRNQRARTGRQNITVGLRQPTNISGQAPPQQLTRAATHDRQHEALGLDAMQQASAGMVHGDGSQQPHGHAVEHSQMQRSGSLGSQIPLPGFLSNPAAGVPATVKTAGRTSVHKFQDSNDENAAPSR